MSSQVCHDIECQNQTLGQYCDRHRCATIACQNAKGLTSQYCTEHSTCKKIGCNTPRYHLDEDEGLAPFCADHWWSCQNLNCGQFIWETSHISPFCAVHGCHGPECSLPALDGRSFCACHVCRVPGQPCTEAGADYHAGRLFCYSHTCGVSGCVNSTVDEDESTNNTYSMCSQHRCPVANCQQVRRNNSAYCSGHTICGKTNCRKAKAVGERFCRRHINTCCKKECYEARAPYGYWYEASMFRLLRWCPQGYSEGCLKHKCIVQECSKTRDLGHNRPFCDDHDFCGKKGCLYTRSKNDRFCGYHRTSCGVKDCFGYMYGYDGSYKGFCENHACRMVRKGCTAERQPNRKFCKQHQTCATPGCIAVCQLPDIACKTHQCYVESCLNAVCSLESKCCQHHVCAKNGCFDAQDNAIDENTPHTYCANHIRSLEPVRKTRTRHDSASIMEEDKVKVIEAKPQDIGDEENAISDEEKVIGDEGEATGEEGKAIGDEEKAIGDEEKVISDEEKATGDEEKAISDEGKATGDEEKAIGDDEEKATGDEEKAISDEGKATGDEEKAIGDDEEKAIGDEEKAISDEGKATGDEEKAIGDDEEKAIGGEEKDNGDEENHIENENNQAVVAPQT